MQFLVFFFLFALAAAQFSDIGSAFTDGLSGAGDKLEQSVDGMKDKVTSTVENLAEGICSPAPERQLKSIVEEIEEAWKSVEKAVILISKIPKVIYDETIQEAANQFKDIKGNATNMVADIKIDMPKIPDSVDLGSGIVVPLH